MKKRGKKIRGVDLACLSKCLYPKIYWVPADVAMQYDNTQAVKDALLLKRAQFYTERSVNAISLTDAELKQRVKLKDDWAQKKRQEPAIAPSLFFALIS